MPNIKKTNAARLLDQLKIGYELIEYAVDESDLGADPRVLATRGEGDAGISA